VTARNEDSNATGVDGEQNDNSATSSGAAYVFTRSGETWSQQAYLKASNTEAYDYYGCSAAISGDTIVVGAHDEDSNATGVNGDEENNLAEQSGAAYVYTRSGVIWSQQAYLKDSDTEPGFFGYSVGIDGDTIVAGANYKDLKGAAYVFTRSGTTWSQQATLTASNGDLEDQFGKSAGISGDTIVVGASEEDGADEVVSGAAYVFTRSGETWSQQAYLKASNSGAGDQFGISAAISGDMIVVGAYHEDSNAVGIDGVDNNLAKDSGAAYVFTRSGDTWSQDAYLKASNTRVYDYFGWAVSISGETIVVGANREDSSSSGVNGDQWNDDALQSGAAYGFDHVPMLVSRSKGSFDGWVLESSENSNTGGSLNATLASFSLGDSAKKQQYRAILDFDTSGLPEDAVITKATLKIKRHSIVGANPFNDHGNIVIDIRNGAFYSNRALQWIDFQAAPTKAYAGIISNTPVAGSWYSGELKSAALPFINLSGITQLRLRFYIDDNNNTATDLMRFYSGNASSPDTQPALVVEYSVPSP